VDNIKIYVKEIDWTMNRLGLSTTGTTAAPVERNMTSGSIKCGEFLDQLRNCQLLKYSTPRTMVLSMAEY
jgi:hypothetical protein